MIKELESFKYRKVDGGGDSRWKEQYILYSKIEKGEYSKLQKLSGKVDRFGGGPEQAARHLEVLLF